MRVMVAVKASKESEAGILPKAGELDAMGKFNEKLVAAGVMLSGDGLHPSSKAKRVRFGHDTVVIDGPFAETKELIAGFWIWNVKSMDEAVEWLKRAPFGAGMEVDIRPLYEVADFGDNATPEILERDQRLRSQIASQTKK